MADTSIQPPAQATPQSSFALIGTRRPTRLATGAGLLLGLGLLLGVSFLVLLFRSTLEIAHDHAVAIRLEQGKANKIPYTNGRRLRLAADSLTGFDVIPWCGGGLAPWLWR